MLRNRRGTGPRRPRRGSALMLVLIFTFALAALALSAVFLTGTASAVTRSFNREQDLRYSAEAALGFGKSQLNANPLMLPDTGYREIPVGTGTITGADGLPVAGVTVRLWAGQTGAPSTGRFATLVAEARDAGGARVARRLEMTQESFAKFAYFSNSETSGGYTIWFTGGDILFGPVWSNDQINLTTASGIRPIFRDSVGTARTLNVAANGQFDRGYLENQRPIPMPNTARMNIYPGLAAGAQLSLTAPTTGAASGVERRIEFVWVDLDADGLPQDDNEGFVRVYTATGTNRSDWLRGDWVNTGIASMRNCGDWHVISGQPKFFPGAAHLQPWFRNLVTTLGPTTTAQVDSEVRNPTNGGSGMTNGSRVIMSHPGARCFLGGDPHLAAIEQNVAIGGDSTTFTPVGLEGSWLAYTGAINPQLLALRPYDAQYLIPISRALNPGFRGVISVAGTVGISGKLRGRVTVHSTRNVVMLDDLTYMTNPGSGQCVDMLGVVAEQNIVIADNALLQPADIDPTGTTVWKVLDDSPDAWVDGVVMTLNTSWTVENYSGGPTSALACAGVTRGRGCLYMTGSLIQANRGPVGTSSGSGFLKRYSYDRCALTNPPPYFPTTGRYADNRYYEHDPARLNVAALFAMLQPAY